MYYVMLQTEEGSPRRRMVVPTEVEHAGPDEREEYEITPPDDAEIQIEGEPGCWTTIPRAVADSGDDNS